MTKALNEKDYAAAIKNADTVLASNYADMDAHFVEYVAHKELKEAEATELHKSVLQGLLDSLMGSGDGKTEETAYVVIDVHEDYVVLWSWACRSPRPMTSQWACVRCRGLCRSTNERAEDDLLQRGYSGQAWALEELRQ